MKATELIVKLQALIKEHGDQNISFADAEGGIEANDVVLVSEEDAKVNPEGFVIC